MNLKNLYNNIQLIELKINDYSNFLKILKIRNEKKIRINMFSQNIIKKKDHLVWIKNHIKKKDKQFYKIYYKKKLVGLVIINNFNCVIKELDWAFYITEKAKKGIGSLVEYKFLKMIFKRKIKKINCMVLEHNKSVIKLHQKFGFRVVKKKTLDVKKGKEFLNYLVLELKEEDWQIKKSLFQLKFGF